MVLGAFSAPSQGGFVADDVQGSRPHELHIYVYVYVRLGSPVLFCKSYMKQNPVQRMHALVLQACGSQNWG